MTSEFLSLISLSLQGVLFEAGYRWILSLTDGSIAGYSNNFFFFTKREKSLGLAPKYRVGWVSRNKVFCFLLSKQLLNKIAQGDVNIFSHLKFSFISTFLPQRKKNFSKLIYVVTSSFFRFSQLNRKWHL